MERHYLEIPVLIVAGTLGAVEEYIWRSDPITLLGTPPSEGWHFTWGSCCRSSNIDNGMN